MGLVLSSSFIDLFEILSVCNTAIHSVVSVCFHLKEESHWKMESDGQYDIIYSGLGSISLAFEVIF